MSHQETFSQTAKLPSYTENTPKGWINEGWQRYDSVLQAT